MRAYPPLLITITAGTPIQVWSVSRKVVRLIIQPMIGGSGAVYVMDGVPPGTTPVTANGNISLAAATSTAPGQAYSDENSPTSPADAIDLQQLWIDGAHSGDVVAISFVDRI